MERSGLAGPPSAFARCRFRLPRLRGESVCRGLELGEVNMPKPETLNPKPGNPISRKALSPETIHWRLEVSSELTRLHDGFLGV